jgi:hypothetical protein
MEKAAQSTRAIIDELLAQAVSALARRCDGAVPAPSQREVPSQAGA